jgi:Na+/proline symporter
MKPTLSLFPTRQKPSAKDADKKMRDKMINKEEKNVRNARFIVIVAGVICAAAVGAAVNIFAHQNEQATFELEVRKTGRRQNHPCLLMSRTTHH